MPDFEFQPWERFSLDVTDGEAHLRVESDGQEWLFRRWGPLWFVREARQIGPEWHYVLQHFLVPIDLDEDMPDAEVWEIAPQDYIAQHWNPEWRRSCGRLFQFDVSGKSVVIGWILGKGWCVYAGLDSFFHGSRTVPFQLETFLCIEETPSSNLYALLQNEYSKPDSALRVSAQLAALPQNERTLAMLELRRGTPQSLVQIVRSALRSFSNTWPPDQNHMTCEFQMSGEKKQFVLEQTHLFSIRERAILNHIIRFFDPQEPVELPDMGSAMRAGLQSKQLRWFSVSAARPSSAHEFTEAYVELKQWLEKNWPDGVKHLGKIAQQDNG